MANPNSRYNRKTQEGSASRYDQAEYVRTGSRYADKAPGNVKEGAKAAGEAAAPAKPAKTEKTAKPVLKNKGTYFDRLSARDPLAIASAILVILIIIAYIITAVFFGSRFYPSTTIYGIDCSGKTAQWTENEIEKRIGDYSLTLNERGGVSEVINASQIGLSYVDEGTVEEHLKKQLSPLWPVMMLRHGEDNVPITTSYDRHGIEDVLKGLSAFSEENEKAPENAYLTLDGGEYVIVPEVPGTTLDLSLTRNAVSKALDTGETSLALDEAGCYVAPLIRTDDEDLIREADARNELLGADITIDFGDRTERIDSTVIAGFMMEDGNGGYAIDPDAVWAYVASLADKYDTFGGHRVFYSSIGTVEELNGGDYGWALNQDATAQGLLDDIRAKKKEVFEPEYVYSAMSRNENDIGDTYVEICISAQIMWCYKDGYKVVETPVVTGNPNRGNETPSGGVWAIDAKMTDYTLVGEGYRAPVAYWLPFNGNVGIHDMQSRYYFGGTIYLSNGSHGCVNTPLDAVEEIYNTVSIGTPVVVYE